MSEQRAHHPYSPSSLQNLEACPCYVNYGESKHERAIAGTLAHAVTESRKDDTRLGDDDAEAAAECMDFFDRRKQLMIEARERAVAKHESLTQKVPEVIEIREEYLPVDDCEFTDFRTVEIIDGQGRKIFVREQMIVKATTAGYCDWALVSHNREYAEMGDYKFGFWPVEHAENNLQAIAYALGLFKRFPSLKVIKFWFKQPHLELTMEATFRREQVAELYLRIQTVVARAREARSRGDFEMASPTVPVCNFCANLGRCTKVLKFACNVASKFYPLEIPAEITPSMVLDREQTTLALRLAQVLAVWASAFKTQVTDRVLRQESVMPSGYTLQSRQDREVVDPAAFKEVTLKHLTQEEYSSVTPIPGFGAVEKLISDKSPRGSKKAAVEDFKKTLEDSGAVKKSDPVVFLRAASGKDES